MTWLSKRSWLIHIGALLPLVWLGVDYFTHNLTFNPVQAATQRTGKTALVLLLFSLALTPFSILFRIPVITKFRKSLGLYAFLYAVLHVLLYVVVDYGLDWGLIWQSLVEKPYVIAGAGAFLILFLLALTSFQWWAKKLGKNWKRLHRLVYLAGALVILHFAWVIKGDIFRLMGNIAEPLLYGLVLLILLAARLPFARRLLGKLSPLG